jgi:drug/metabolite transporter (DMT)-like permease
MAQDGQIRRGVALAALAALLFGVTAPLLKRASAGAGPLLSGALLYLGAAVAGALMTILRRRAAGASLLTAPTLGRLLAIALIGAVVAPAALVVGLRRTDAATASLLLALEAPFTLVLARAVLGEYLGRRVLVAALLIFLGAGSLVGGSFGAQAGLSGSILIAAAAFAWAIDNLLSRALADREPLAVVALKGSLGGLLGLGAGLALGEARPGSGAALALLALGAFGYGVSLQLYLRAQRLVGAARTASVFAIAPFVGVLAAFGLGAPWPGGSFVAASVLVGLGLALHLSERHQHGHRHQVMEHEHLHTHDDGHHDHVHDPMPAGPHSHGHRHEPLAHEHEHSEDLHHHHAH